MRWTATGDTPAAAIVVRARVEVFDSRFPAKQHLMRRSPELVCRVRNNVVNEACRIDSLRPQFEHFICRYHRACCLGNCLVEPFSDTIELVSIWWCAVVDRASLGEKILQLFRQVFTSIIRFETADNSCDVYLFEAVFFRELPI